jgi:Asp-tRNA(Asn)/Glu-tRNA(Gln) amidotransferase A subunit family amidase
MHTKPAVRPNCLPAHVAAEAIRCGRLTSLDLTLSCLERIEAREASVGAWCYLDRDQTIAQAREADKRQRAGGDLGVLHGLPIGIKDVFDTSDMPSEYGSPSLRGRRPTSDADAVARLRAAGAIIMGKTVTSEFGMYAHSSCRNPHDERRSPGVSSAGSAAAVADEMVPLALGTQHTASTLLPASFCGAFGFKPSFAFTSMRGSNILVPRLATVGFLTRNLDDLALFASVFAQGFKAPVEPLAPQRLGVVRGPAWDKVDADARTAFDVWLKTLPTAVVEIELPGEFASAIEVTHGLLAAHLAHRFVPMPEATQATYCAPLRTAIATGLRFRATDYLEMDAQADRLTEAARGLFASCDALITLSTLGEATLLCDGPGSGELTMPWSLAGLPTLSLPLLRGDRGLPIGVQLIGAPVDDRRLLSIAAWLTGSVCPPGPEAKQT